MGALFGFSSVIFIWAAFCELGKAIESGEERMARLAALVPSIPRLVHVMYRTTGNIDNRNKLNYL